MNTTGGVSRLHRLCEIHAALAATTDEDTLLRQVLDAAVELAGGDAGVLYTRDAGKRHFAPRLVTPALPHAAAPPEPAVDGLLRQVAGDGRPVAGRAPAQPPLPPDATPAPVALAPATLLGGGAAVLWIQRTAANAPFGRDDLEMLDLLARAFELRLQHLARTDEGNRLSVLSELHRVSRALLAEHNPMALLERIVTVAREVLRADVVALYEYSERRGSVQLPPYVAGDLSDPDLVQAKGVLHVREGSKVFHVLARRDPLYVPNAPTGWAASGLEAPHGARSRPRFVQRERIKSCAAVPLYYQDRPVGVLFVNYRTRCPFTGAEREAIELFAGHAALAIGNARLLEQKTRAANELAALNEIGQILSSKVALDPAVVLEALYEQTARVMDVPNFYVALYDEARDEVSFPFAVEEGRRTPDIGPDFAPRPRGNGLTEYVIRKRTSLLLKDDIAAWRDRNDVQLVGRPAMTWLGVPMIADDKVVGVIGVQDYWEEHAYDEDDQAVLETIAAQAAIALSRSRLLAEERRVWREQARLQQVRDALAAADELKQAADRLLDEVGAIVEYQKATLQIIWDGSRELVARRGYDEALIADRLLGPVQEDPLVRRAVEARGPLVVPDTACEEGWLAQPSTADVRSWMCIPLVHKGDAIGLLLLDHLQPGFYTDDHATRLLPFARSAADILGRARLYEDAQARLHGLQVVERILSGVGGHLDTERLSDEVARQAMGNLGCDSCSLFYLEEEDGKHVLRRAGRAAAAGDAAGPSSRAVAALAETVLAAGSPLVVDDARQHPRVAELLLAAEDALPVLLVPIAVGQRSVGVVAATKAAGKRFTQGDKVILGALANHLGVAMERSVGLALLKQVAVDILAANDSDEVLERIISGALRLVHARSGVFVLLDRRGRQIDKTVPYPKGSYHPTPRMDNENGITRTVIKMKETIVIQDLARDGRVNPKLLRDYGSMVAVPLQNRGRVLGVMFLNNFARRDFTETEITLLETLADQAAIAMAKAELVERLKRSNRELTVLNAIAQTVTSTDLDEIARVVYDKVEELLEANDFFLGVYDAAADYVRFHWIVRGEAKTGVEGRLGADGLTERVIRRRKPLLIRDWRKVKHRYPFAAQIVTREQRSWLGVPMLVGDKVVGLLSVQSEKAERFDLRATRLLKTIAAQAAVVVENARLIQEMEQKVQERT